MRGKLGAFLITSGKLTEDQLNVILNVAKKSNQGSREVAISLGFITENGFTEALSERFLINIIDSLAVTIDRLVASKISEEFAKSELALPLRIKKIGSKSLLLIH
ncbi:MAG: hypothetical protein ACN4E2_01930 [Nitrospinota bacterium]